MTKAEQDVSSLCYAPTDHSTSSGGSRSEPHRPSDVQTDDWHSVHRDMCRFGILGIVSINTCSMCFEIQAGPWNGRIGGWGDYNCASNEPQPKCIVEHDEDDGWLQRRLDRNNCEITH